MDCPGVTQAFTLSLAMMYSASQEVTDFHCSFHKTHHWPLAWTSLTHLYSQFICNIHFNIILLFMSRFSKSLLPLMFPNQNLYTFLTSPMHAACLTHLY
jgi:hypothetical protein